MKDLAVMDLVEIEYEGQTYRGRVQNFINGFSGQPLEKQGFAIEINTPDEWFKRVFLKDLDSVKLVAKFLKDK